MSTTASTGSLEQTNYNNNRTNNTNSGKLLNDLAYDSSSSTSSSSVVLTPSTSPHTQYQDLDEQPMSQQQQQQQSVSQYKQPFQTNYNQTGEVNNFSNMMMYMNSYQNSSFNSSLANSSGLGDSISLPCSMESSVAYGNPGVHSASTTRQLDFINSSGSIPCAPASPIKNDDSSDSSPTHSMSPSLLQAKLLKQHQLAKMASLNTSTPSVQQIQKMLSNDATKSNYLVNGLNTQMVDYDPFNDYMGMDKMMLNSPSSGQDPASLLKSKMAALQLNSSSQQFDAQQQQQMLAQAYAMSVANQDLREQSNKPNNNSNSMQQTRSLSENIELLNSKFQLMNQQKTNTNTISNNSNNNNTNANQQQTNSNGTNDSINNLNSLLATVAAAVSASESGTSPFMAYPNQTSASTNATSASKRLSFPQSGMTSNTTPSPPPPSNHHQSTSSPFMNSSSLSKQLINSNLFGSVNLNLLNQNDRSGQLLSTSLSGHHGDNKPSASLSQSNSAFNLSNNSTSMDPTMSQFNPNQSALSAHNSSCYDDDDVFTSTNCSMNSTNANSSFTNQAAQLLPSSQADQVTLATLYRNFISNPANNSNNVNEFIANYNANLAAFSLNPELASNFLNSNTSQANSTSGTNNKTSSTSTSTTSNANQQLTPQQQQQMVAVLKQRQNMLLNNRLSSVLANPSSANTGASNIAALTSATSNIAALLNNNNNSNSANGTAQQQFLNANANTAAALLNDPTLKRRVNSQSSFSSATPTNTPALFGGAHTIGPNATHLLQNSSLASSARLNTSTSTSAAASVLGNNSSLSHALNSLSQHQAGLGLANASNSHLLAGGSLNSSLNGCNFTSSPAAASSQGILSALSLSSSSKPGSSVTSASTALLSSSGKPLRSERLDSSLVEEIIRQAKLRRRNGGKKEVCVFCRNNGEKEQIYTSHTLKDASNHVACPILRLYQCPICHASGDQAHTIKYCPYAEKDNACMKLFKESGRMSAAAALLMNSLGPDSSPSLSPPPTPSPVSASQAMNFLSQQQQSAQQTSSQQDVVSSPNFSSAAYAAFSQLGSYGAMTNSSLALTPQNQSSKSSFLSSLNAQTSNINNNNNANSSTNSILNNSNSYSNSTNNNNNNNTSSLLSSNFSNSANLKQIN